MFFYLFLTTSHTALLSSHMILELFLSEFAWWNECKYFSFPGKQPSSLLKPLAFLNHFRFMFPLNFVDQKWTKYSLGVLTSLEGSATISSLDMKNSVLLMQSKIAYLIFEASGPKILWSFLNDKFLLPSCAIDTFQNGELHFFFCITFHFVILFYNVQPIKDILNLSLFLKD